MADTNGGGLLKILDDAGARIIALEAAHAKVVEDAQRMELELVRLREKVKKYEKAIDGASSPSHGRGDSDGDN